MGNEDIVNFAIHVLGCGCDHSVFNTIEKNENVMLDCGVRLSKKIIIGNRLLIYLTCADELRPENLQSVIDAGLKERDEYGYNRLRLAVVTEDVRNFAPVYLQAFANLARKDDRTHIHVIPQDVAV